MRLEEVIPWGRNLNEYRRMFSLSAANLEKSILGCSDGPASFNAEMTQQGHSVISVDPIYEFSAEQIRQRIEAIYDTVISQVKAQSERFVWKNFANADELGQSRLQTMTAFLRDYEQGKLEGRYQHQALPKLNFEDQQFELCLCANFLFLYSDRLSQVFHLEALRELLRVAAEVRVFPLLDLMGDRSPYVEPVIEKLDAQNFKTRIKKVDYEFQRGGNEMLVITSL
ncbi:SAM-dependent methyltransferase [[Limnothrix rosea] IAM M-220]|uniref:SAM-dependent methyltransferase n=1 Tax=[Limnothrix rosea] IAM M-220 TaxID=454133 RepID=UPI00095E934F|nr:SAM-dependent methyltransferase [[Limnothrix rosea] IAM M-220]OKH19735.1 SAM-dependent methyltransferase [[Limnothrix rosea] IAM M-220]